MLRDYLLLAQLEPKDLEAIKDAAKRPSPKLFDTDITVILGLVLALAAILFFWAFFVRKRPKQVRGALVLEAAEKRSRDAYGSSGRRRRHRRRPDHPDNWGRNPTLGETGGLPPARPEEPETPPSAPQSPSPH